MNSRLLFLIGTIHWFGITLIHPILVDIDLILGLNSPIGPEVVPDGDQVRATLMANTWEFGWGGETTVHRAFSGFSLWVVMSSMFLALINLFIGCSPELPQTLLYRLTILNLAAYVVFMVLSFTCFVFLPQLNGVGGTLFFALAAWTMVREQSTVKRREKA